MSFIIPQFSSVAQSCPTLCDLMDCSAPSFPAHYQLPEFTQIHVHRVCDAIQPSHPLLSPFSSHLQSFPASRSFPVKRNQLVKVFEFQLHPPMNIQGLFPLGCTSLISLQSKGLSRVFSNTPVQKYPFFHTFFL